MAPTLKLSTGVPATSRKAGTLPTQPWIVTIVSLAMALSSIVSVRLARRTGTPCAGVDQWTRRSRRRAARGRAPVEGPGETTACGPEPVCAVTRESDDPAPGPGQRPPRAVAMPRRKAV
ncbi:hypothetical protein GCM10025786_13880 [Nocardioides caeni]